MTTLKELLQASPQATYYRSPEGRLGAEQLWRADSLLVDMTEGENLSGLSHLLDKEILVQRFAIFSVPPLGYPMVSPILHTTDAHATAGTLHALNSVTPEERA